MGSHVPHDRLPVTTKLYRRVLRVLGHKEEPVSFNYESFDQHLAVHTGDVVVLAPRLQRAVCRPLWS
jgi:hypothetical protein